MSITAETAKQHANDPAVLCCRAEEGTVLEPANFEDPAIFPDLIDSGRLDVSSMVHAVCGLEDLPHILAEPELRAKGKYIISPER